MSRRFRGTSVADYEEEARKNLDGDANNFYSSGADGEATLTENRSAWKRYRLRPRVLRGITNIDLSTTILGHRISFPVCVAPTAWHRFAHLDAEQATAKGATAAGVAMTLSSVSTTPCHQVTASHPGGIFFMQSYVVKNLALHWMMLSRLREFGFKAVVLSVDCPMISNRRVGFSSATVKRLVSEEMQVINYIQEEAESKSANEKGYREFFNFFLDQVHNSSPASLDTIRWVKTCSGLPVIAKGILTGRAAREAVDHGADAIWVSNHGGRQLDYTPSTLDVLPEIVEAVRGTNTEVYIDSGVRTGADTFKAIALGAQAVFIGRPVLWGLATAGSNGVLDILSLLRRELELCMTLAGCPTIDSITADHVIYEGEYLASKL